MQVKNKPRRLPTHSIDLNKFFERYIDRGLVENEKLIEDEVEYLVEAKIENLINGSIYINASGHSLRYVEEEAGDSFEFITRTPLFIWNGGNVEELTQRQLRLFWILIKNDEIRRGIRDEENTN